jgi:hypothetical protein
MKEHSRTEEKPNMQRENLLTQKRRSMLLVSLVLAVLVLLVGCAPRATSGQLAANADSADVVIDLPALVIDVLANGQLSLGGQSLVDLGSQFGTDLAAAALPQETVDFLTVSNIQHIQVDNTAEGLLILVNGKPIPSLAWDGEKLVATAEVLDTLGAGVALLDKVLPLVTNMGIGVIIRFPVASGTDTMPMVAIDDEIAAQSRAAQEQFLAAVGTPPTFQLTVQYAPDGTWTVADLAQSQWSQLLPIPWESLNLSPDLVSQVSAAGIGEIGLATNSDGIFISINGKTLPYITWADGRVNQLLALAQETGLLSQVLGADPNMQAIMDTVTSLLPAVQASNVSLRVTFPE